MTNPLVSCLCVTRGAAHLQRAIDCWSAQTYPNRELVIVYDGDPRALCAFTLPPEARTLHIRHPLNLGQLRNASVSFARGEYLCQWDDDDWCHPERIERQLDFARAYGACALRQWVMWHGPSKGAYLSSRRCWEGSMLWHRSRTGPGYPALARGEDTPFARFVKPAPLDAPDLYIYNYHGGNTWDAAHFERLFACATPLSADASAIVGRRLGVF